MGDGEGGIGEGGEKAVAGQHNNVTMHVRLLIVSIIVADSRALLKPLISSISFILDKRTWKPATI